MHKDTTAKEYRVWLRESSIKQVKTLALILNREDWHQVLDDVVRVGVAYVNEAAKLELASYSDTLKLFNLGTDMKLTVLSGEELPNIAE